MKYQANPFIVEAFQITIVRGIWANGNAALTLENGLEVEALPDVTARVNPKVGDYWVIHEDGFICLAPKKAFERMYKPAKKAKGSFV